MSLLLTFITGLFFLLGMLLNKVFKNTDNINVFSISLAFVVIINLIIFDIAPEVFESFSYLSILFIILGVILLKVFDLLIPHHHHDHDEENDDINEHHQHLEHISIITILALSLHNIIECMALYQVSSNVKAGIMMCLGIGLHNIPLGLVIGNKIQKNKIIYIILLVLSGFIGGIISHFIGNIPEQIIIYVLAFTLGMLIYLALFELLKEMINYRKNKYTIYGVIIGIILVVLTGLL